MYKGPDQKQNQFRSCQRENDVIFLDDKDHERFASYDQLLQNH